MSIFFTSCGSSNSLRIPIYLNSFLELVFVVSTIVKIYVHSPPGAATLEIRVKAFFAACIGFLPVYRPPLGESSSFPVPIGTGGEFSVSILSTMILKYRLPGSSSSLSSLPPSFLAFDLTGPFAGAAFLAGTAFLPFFGGGADSSSSSTSLSTSETISSLSTSETISSLSTSETISSLSLSLSISTSLSDSGSGFFGGARRRGIFKKVLFE